MEQGIKNEIKANPSVNSLIIFLIAEVISSIGLIIYYFDPSNGSLILFLLMLITFTPGFLGGYYLGIKGIMYENSKKIKLLSFFVLLPAVLQTMYIVIVNIK